MAQIDAVRGVPMRAALPHVCGMPLWKRNGRLLFMIKAFFDEATDGANDFLMGGWLARFDEWEKFSDAWDAELRYAPRIAYFNHNEALGLKNQFAGWSNSKRDDKMMALAGVIARYNLIGLVGHVSIPQLSRLFENSIIPRRTLRSIIKYTEPYHHACQGVVAVTLGYQVVKAKNVTDRVDFIFDEGVPYLDDIIANYPRLKEVLPAPAVNIAGTIVAGNDKEIVALQAADFLVGQKLLHLRLNVEPNPLAVVSAKVEKTFPCSGKELESIPTSMSKLNVIWATKRLAKVQEPKRRRDRHERKKKE